MKTRGYAEKTIGSTDFYVGFNLLSFGLGFRYCTWKKTKWSGAQVRSTDAEVYLGPVTVGFFR